MSASDNAPLQPSDLKTRLCKKYEDESAHWRSEKNDYSKVDDWWWTLKARARLFQEAAALIEEIPLTEDMTIDSLELAVLQALRENPDWGWGENWSDKIHNEVLMKVFLTAIRFFKNPGK
ncbi:MAG: hypothetical protein V1816_05300 [Pseudomonadota bacterium]